MKQPSVSVILPVYNAQPYLRDCLDSLAQQTLRELEIICVDDGSTDASADILASYAAADRRFRTLRQENGGAGRARNAAMETARGQYLYCMDADDVLEPGALAALWERCSALELDLLCFSGQSFYETPELEQQFPWFATAYHRSADYPDALPGPELFARMRESGDYYASPCLLLFRTAFVREKRIRFPEGIFYEDELFTFSATIQARRASCVPQVWFHRRVREDSLMTRQTSLLNSLSYYRVFREMDALLGRLSLSQAHLRACRAHQLRLLNNARRKYLALDSPEEPADDYLFTALVADWCQERRAQEQQRQKAEALRAELRETKDKLKQTYAEKSEINAKLQLTYREKFDRGVEIKSLKAEQNRLRAELSEAEGALEDTKAQLSQTKEQLGQCRAELKQAKSTLGYRIQRKLTGEK